MHIYFIVAAFTYGTETNLALLTDLHILLRQYPIKPKYDNGPSISDVTAMGAVKLLYTQERVSRFENRLRDIYLNQGSQTQIHLGAARDSKKHLTGRIENVKKKIQTLNFQSNIEKIGKMTKLKKSSFFSLAGSVFETPDINIV